MFTPSKVGQIAACFALWAGGTLNVMKLVKLLYLVDRESIDRYGLPITFDRLVSMPHGPVPSMSLDLINGALDPVLVADWERWMAPRANHDVHLARAFVRADLDELSDADLQVIEEIWKRFGHMDQWQLRDFTHENCPEWRDPKGSQLPIHDRNILMALGLPRERAVEQAREIAAQRRLDELLTR